MILILRNKPYTYLFILDSLRDRVVFRIFSSVRYQTIEGFGGSVTDAASINWRKLTDGAQTQFIK